MLIFRIFFVQLYNLIIEYRPGRDEGEILAKALKIMLCDDRQHDMQRGCSFYKHLATFCLCSGSAESLAVLVTLKHLLQKNIKCRNLLENDAGGGSVSGAIAHLASSMRKGGVLHQTMFHKSVVKFGQRYFPNPVSDEKAMEGGAEILACYTVTGSTFIAMVYQVKKYLDEQKAFRLELQASHLEFERALEQLRAQNRALEQLRPKNSKSQERDRY